MENHETLSIQRSDTANALRLADANEKQGRRHEDTKYIWDFSSTNDNIDNWLWYNLKIFVPSVSLHGGWHAVCKFHHRRRGSIAMNACNVLWNLPMKFKNVMLHLGDFHFMKENFAVMGNMIAGSGFEDVVFQADICFSGCLNGIHSGYNRCWAIHSLFYTKP